jgi:hypothetical protein
MTDRKSDDRSSWINTMTRMTKTSSILAALAMIAGMGIAGAASAIGYSETLIFSDLDNNGYVTPATPLTYTHSMVTDDIILSIDSVNLQIAITDDFFCSSWEECIVDWSAQAETAEIAVNGIEWQDGQATMQIFFGDVTLLAQLTQVQMDMEVTISSADLDLGDFQVWSSRMNVEYTTDGGSGGGGAGGPGAPMPEPNAAFAFLIGAMTISMRIRRQG